MGIRRALAILLLLLLADRPLAAASPAAREVIRLRESRQFEAAEQAAQRRLGEKSLSDDVRLDLTLELSRTWAEHALASPAEESAERWKQAQQVLDDFTARHLQHPKLLLVRAQGALAELSRAQRAREDAELAGDDPQDLKAARELLRSSISRITRLHEDVEKQIHAAPRAGDRRAVALTSAELQSLELNLRLHWARALGEQALSYGPTSADRINSLSRALEVLKPLGSLDLTTPLAWSARLDEIECLRSIEDSTAAEHRLQALASAAPPADLQGRLRAERTRVALARGQLDEALAEAAPGAPRGASDWTEADLALLETYLALWAQADERREQTRADEWQQAAAEQMGTIAREHGARVARRADLLLKRHLAGREQSLLPAMQLRVAEGLDRGGKPAAALAAYTRVAQAARVRGLAELAYAAELSAAQLEEAQEHFAEAAQRFRALALASQAQERAAEVHLQAVYCAAQHARRQPSPQLAQYEQLLEEHLATWPAAETAQQALSWLGRLREQQGAYAQAIEVLGRIRIDAPQFTTAIQAAGRCYESWLANLQQEGKPTSEVANKAIAQFEAIALPGRKLPRTWTPSQRAAVAALARIALRRSPREALQAEELLHAALNADPPPEPHVAQELQTLRIVALAAGERPEQAEQAWQRSGLSDSAAQELVAILSQMRSIAADDRRRAVARLELAVVDDLLTRQKVEANLERDLRRQRIELRAALGQRRQALAELTALAGEHPADGQMQEALARLLAVGDRASIAQAADKWREVVGKCRPGSPRWWRAHYGLARAQFDLGQISDCLATIRSLEATPGDFGGPDMKARFVQLERLCAQENSGTPRTTK